MEQALRVAVVGASGIGRHHAKWHHLAGCRVVAFLGTSPESCRATEKELRELFGFAGRGYCDWDELVLNEKPEVVDVCAPNDRHAEYIDRALEAGCHVLCEKPLVWREDGAAEILEDAAALVDKAAALDRRFGVCTQYSVALPHYERLYAAVRGPFGPVTQFDAEMETLARGRRRSAVDVWVDMGSHPLSLLLGWIPDGRIDPVSLKVDFADRRSAVGFDFVHGEGRCRCRIVVADIDRGPPARRFGVNGLLVDCQGKNDAEGVYRIALRHGEHEVFEQDYMSLLIEGFVAACRRGSPPRPDAATGRRNLELQLEILGRAV